MHGMNNVKFKEWFPALRKLKLFRKSYLSIREVTSSYVLPATILPKNLAQLFVLRGLEPLPQIT